MPKTYSVVETAKIIRQELKTKFPKTKFSVTSSKYSMGASININWKDGYTKSEVYEVVNRFESKGPSQIDDYIPTVTDIWKNQVVRWGSDYVNCSRSISEYAKTALTDHFSENIEPLLKAESFYSKELPSDYQSIYLRRFIESINLHNQEWFHEKVIFEVERDSAKAYPISAVAEELGIKENTKVDLLKVTTFKFDPTAKYDPEICLVKSWVYKGKSYPLSMFCDNLSSQDKVINVDFSQSKFIDDLIVEGVQLEGKIKKFVIDNNFQFESLESIYYHFCSDSRDNQNQT